MAVLVDDLKRIPMSAPLAETLARATEYAAAQSHSQVVLEHLLLALTEDPDATLVLSASHVDMALLKADVSQFLGGLTDLIAPVPVAHLVIAPDLKRILEAAAAAANQGRRRDINGAIVLAAIIGDGRSSAAHMLRAQGLTFEEAIKALQQAMAQPPKAAEPVSKVPTEPVAQASSPFIAAAPAPVDAENVLASARARVQTRTAPPPPRAVVERVVERVPVPVQHTEVAAPFVDSAPVRTWPPEVRASLQPEAGFVPAELPPPPPLALPPVADATAPPPPPPPPLPAFRPDPDTAPQGYDVAVVPHPPHRSTLQPDAGALSLRSEWLEREAAVSEPRTQQDLRDVGGLIDEPPAQPINPAPAPPRDAYVPHEPPQPRYPQAAPQPAPRVRPALPQPGTRWPAAVAPAWKDTPQWQPPASEPLGPPPLPVVERDDPAFEFPAPTAMVAPFAAAPAVADYDRLPMDAAETWADDHGDAPLADYEQAVLHEQNEGYWADQQASETTHGRPDIQPDAWRTYGPDAPAPDADAYSRNPPVVEDWTYQGAPDDAMQAHAAPPHHEEAAQYRPPTPRGYPGEAALAVPVELARPPRRRKSMDTMAVQQLVEGIPARMRVGRPSTVEVRLAKDEMVALADGLQGLGSHSEPVAAATALSVKLRAPDGSFVIESVTPETQWSQGPMGAVDHDFAGWRWTVTPQRSGKRQLLLTASVRGLTTAGVALDHTLPEQTVTVRAGRNYGRFALNVLAWSMIATAGAAIAIYGQPLFNPVLAEVMKLIK